MMKTAAMLTYASFVVLIILYGYDVGLERGKSWLAASIALRFMCTTSIYGCLCLMIDKMVRCGTQGRVYSIVFAVVYSQFGVVPLLGCVAQAYTWFFQNEASTLFSYVIGLALVASLVAVGLIFLIKEKRDYNYNF